MFQVEKRDGGVKDFDLNKITGAISKLLTQCRWNIMTIS